MRQLGEPSAADDLAASYARLRAAWERAGGVTLPARAAALRRLRAEILGRADAFVRTIDADFGGRSRHETLIAEIAGVLRAIDHALPRLRHWAAPERVALGWPFWPARARIRKQPRGVVGIIGPANFPVQLTILPLVGAIAAGCRALVKASELTPRTAELLADALAAAFDPEEVAVVGGDAAVAVALCRLPLDHLLFTGSSANGRKVMAAAAEQLTPLTLELGGKSPAVLGRDADVARAAAAIVAGKLMNAGQTCIAPDYVLVPRERRDAFLAAACAAADTLYPDPGGPAYTSVRGAAAQARLAALAAGLDCRPMLAKPVRAPNIAPRLVVEPPLSSAIMRTEIFGPLLPVVSYETLDHAVAIINGLPRPLALYWFGAPRGAAFRAVLDRTLSGAVAVNETVLQAAIEALPFGGIGQSGFGAYHGRAGFDTFTYRRPVFIQSRLGVTNLLKPPYGRRAERIIRSMLR